MKDSLRLLPARDSKLKQIQELAYSIWPVYYASIISMEQIEFMLKRLYSLDSLAAQVAGGHRFFIGRIAGTPVGFLDLHPVSAKELKLEKLYLSEACRGKGMGRRMMELAEAQAKEGGFSYLILNVNRFNSSLDFYKHQGFRIREQVDIPFGPFVLNDFIMEKEID